MNVALQDAVSAPMKTTQKAIDYATHEGIETRVWGYDKSMNPYDWEYEIELFSAWDKGYDSVHSVENGCVYIFSPNPAKFRIKEQTEAGAVLERV